MVCSRYHGGAVIRCLLVPDKLIDLWHVILRNHRFTGLFFDWNQLAFSTAQF